VTGGRRRRRNQLLDGLK